MEGSGRGEFLPGQAEALYKDMFILYWSFRKETASLCAENHLHCKSSTRGSNRPPQDEPQRNSRSNAGVWTDKRRLKARLRKAGTPSSAPSLSLSHRRTQAQHTHRGPAARQPRALLQRCSSRPPPVRGSAAMPPSNEPPLDNCGYYPLCLDLFKPFCWEPHQVGKPLVLRPAEVDASHYGFNRTLFDDY